MQARDIPGGDWSVQPGRARHNEALPFPPGGSRGCRPSRAASTTGTCGSVWRKSGALPGREAR